MPEIIPTVVPECADDIAAALSRFAFAQTLHVDLTDGTLTRNSTWLPGVSSGFPRGELAYEVHLMVANPRDLGIACVRAGVVRLIAHIESFPDVEHAHEVFGAWRAAGVREIGVALTMQTQINTVDPYIPLLDFVQLMTIETIGAQGQPFDTRSLERIGALHKKYPTLVLSVDGGVSLENIANLAGAGATRFCVGSSLARLENPASTYVELVKAANAVS